MNKNLKNRVLRIVFYGFIFSLFFTMGAVFYREKPFPYEHIQRGAKVLINLVKPAKVTKKPSLNEIFSNPVESLGSVLMPLTKKIIPLDSFNLSKSAGAITSIENDIIVVDRLGKFFLVQMDKNKILKLDLPKIPRNIEKFISDGKHLGNFRVHDIASNKDSNNLKLYISYEKYNFQTKKTSLAVSYIDISDGYQPTSQWKEIYKSQPLNAAIYKGQAAGGRIFVDGERVLLTVGDYQQDSVSYKSQQESQNINSDFGSIISIEAHSKLRKTISIGHRNPQGLIVTQNGNIISTEHGPFGGDELNEIKVDGNYGWPLTTYGTDYRSFDWPPKTDISNIKNYQKPLYVWIPSVAVSNLVELVDFHPLWRGDLLVGSLKSKSLYRIRRNSKGEIIYSERIVIGERIRDLTVLSNGTIVLWTDNAQLIKINTDKEKLALNRRITPSLDSPILSNCFTCHHIGPTNTFHLAPSLSKIIGRKIGGDVFKLYSKSLKSNTEFWNENNLVEFLTDPRKFSPGTTMAYSVDSKLEAEKIIKLLATIK